MNEGTGDNFNEILNIKESPVLLRAAEKEIKEKNFNRAIGLLEKLISIDQGNASAYFLLGKAYTGAANFRSALHNFKRGSELIRSEKTYQFYLREIEHCKRQLEEKENHVTDAVSSDYSTLFQHSGNKFPAEQEEPSESDENIISETLAKIYLSQNQAGEAVKVYKRLINKYPLKKLYFEAKISEISSGAK